MNHYWQLFSRDSWSGEEALAKIAEERPNLIITDIEMPEYDGYDLIEKVHRMTENKSHPISVAALTAFTDEKALKKISDAGFDARFSKPVHADELIFSVRNLVGTDHLH